MSRLLVFSLLLLLLTPFAALAQEEGTLVLRLSRDFGAGFGTDIEGRFSMRVDEPPVEVVRVEFLLDDVVIGEVDAPPFRWQFSTSEYAPGTHRMQAVGYTAVNEAIPSNTITRNFLSGSESRSRMLWVVLPLLLLVVGGRILANRIANRGRKVEKGQANVHGPFGGTICRKCGRPFARHWWGFNIVVGKYDRCPHCGKWSIVQALPPEVLDSVVEALDTPESIPASTPEDEAAKRRKQLNDSRFHE
jgi:hypothetical protein